MSVIGNGSQQVPAGSDIIVARLYLKADIGGDGQLYRCARAWDGTPTWSELGNELTRTAGPPIQIGLNTGQGKNFDVTSHVQLWADNTANEGWITKGWVDDCQVERLNVSAIRLYVEFTPPDTTRPQVEDVDVGSTTSTHPDYDVPDGSGNQIKTIQIGGGINQFFVNFSEAMAPSLNPSNFSVKSAITGSTYPIQDHSHNPSTFVSTLLLQDQITSPDQIILTVHTSASDVAGNSLNGFWDNPTHVDATGSSTFPSGTGGTHQFEFFMTYLPTDFNHDNVVNGSDLSILFSHFGTTSGASQSEGDANGDGIVGGSDYLLWQLQYGLDYSSWTTNPIMSPGGGAGSQQASLQEVLEEYGLWLLSISLP